jgi:hypothetical protein
MSKLHVEKIGGLAGFGGARSHLRSRGEVDLAALTDGEQQEVEKLFQTHSKKKSSPVRDGFMYRIARTTLKGQETIEVPEGAVPTTISQCVKDELA